MIQKQLEVPQKWINIKVVVAHENKNEGNSLQVVIVLLHKVAINPRVIIQTLEAIDDISKGKT